MAYTKYSLTPANNTAAPPDGAPEGMLPSAVNDTMRDMMAQIRDVGDGVRDGTYTMTAPKITGGSITGVTLTGNTLTNPVITGATLTTSAFNGAVGATTASTGAFTTLSTSSTTTFTGLTASTALALDASKNVVSVTNTGTGSNVLSASPTLTGTIAGASLSLSSLTSGRVTYAGASGLLTDSSTFVFNGNLGLGAATTSGGRLVITQDNAVQPAIYLPTDESTIQGPSANTKILMGGNLTVQSANVTTISAKNASGYIVFATGSTPTEGLRLTTSSLYTASGVNVGIGTSSPQANLQVTSSSFPVLKVADALGGGAVALGDSTITSNYVGIWRGAVNSISGGGFLNVQGNGIAFMSTDNVFGSATRTMTLDNGGNLLLGTTASNYRLNVKGGGTVGDSSVYAQFTTLDTGTTATDGLLIGLGVGSSPAAYVGQYENAPLIFLTNGTEKVRIDSSGNLLVGKTVTTFTTDGVWLQPAGTAWMSRDSDVSLVLNRNGTDGQTAQFYKAGTQVGSISVTTTLTSYNVSSDYRLKENIAPMTGALKKVAQLNPVTYKWKIDGSDGQGFIAHELAEVVPDCVTGEKDAVDENGKPQYQAMDTSHLVATLVSAIQEQQALIQSLTTRLTALENK